MKKNFMYAFLSAIALSGAVSFSACSSSDEIIDNPNYDPETNTVKTQFTISLPSNVANSTRQSAYTVQDAQTTASFRGFDNIVLIPYGAVSSGNVSGNRLTATSITLNPTTGSANTLPAGGLATYNENYINNAYVYSDVNIPLGTSGFLFYGKAIDAGTNKFVDGALTASPTNATIDPNGGLTGEKTGFGFALNVIKESDGKATALLNYIKSIAAAAPASGAAWYTPVASGGNAGLLELYEKFITLKAGSSTSVQAALEDLYESLMNNTDAASQAVCTAILDDGNKATYTAGNAENERLALNASIAGYPADINLPDGAVGLSWSNATPAVPSWLHDNSAWSTGSAVTALDKYVYPASLYYRADSPIKVSASKQSESYSGKNGWENILTLYDDGSVGPSTQSVAIKEQIQYAVAQLKSTIKIAAATLKDRNGDEIKIGTTGTDDGTFTVTGILIGGQKNVDWEFLPTGTDIYTIYDNDIPNAGNANVLSATTSEVVNYTLALENTVGEDVFIAIEFENNAKDFIGKNGLIAKGTKFYLVGKLDPEAPTSGSLDKVFKQDYVTTANFTINANAGELTNPTDPTSVVYTKGLAAAYNVIPDLRTPLMELGLSVDLTWQPGNTFTVDLGQ